VGRTEVAGIVGNQFHDFVLVQRVLDRFADDYKFREQGQDNQEGSKGAQNKADNPAHPSSRSEVL
jgi:hypothetical protein